MTVTRDTIVVGVEPRDMTEEAFTRVLVDAGSPAASVASASYKVLLEYGVSIRFALAVFHHESQYATDPDAIVVKFNTNNPGNTRSSRIGRGVVIDTPKGPFVDHANWLDGWRDLVFRLIDPTYVYAQENRRSIFRVIERFAPSSDGNAPLVYSNAVVADMNRWEASAPVPPTPNRPLHIALSSGHHNTSGGNATEIRQTGPLTVAIANACRARGFDTRVVQPDNGMGHFNGTLSDVARVVVGWDASWEVDLFLEAHTEGAGGARGAFAIYPDWSPDVDVDVRDTLGPDIVRRLQASTGMPVRNIKPPNSSGPLGVMSERQTGVGAGGDRLGIFRVTEPLRDHCTRLIVEFGAHDNAADLAIFNSPGFLAHAGNAVADSIAAFYGVTPQPQPPPNDEFWLPDAKYPFVLGFAGHVSRIGAAVMPSDPPLGALAVFGQPLEREYEGEDGNSYQRTQRYVLQWQPNTAPPFDIVGVIRGEKIPKPKEKTPT